MEFIKWVFGYQSPDPEQEKTTKKQKGPSFNQLLYQDKYKDLHYVNSIWEGELRDAYSRKIRAPHILQEINKVYDEQMVLISIDVEAFERDHSVVTEVGIAVYEPKSSRGMVMPFIQSGHIVIAGTEDVRNGTFVADHKDFFNGGKTLTMDLHSAAQAIKDLISKHTRKGTRYGTGVCLVGHGIGQDVKWLKHIGVSIGSARILDTQKLLCMTHGKKGSSLKNGLKLVRQPCAFLHNAGNDAYYTMVLCLCLADPLYRVAAAVDGKQTIETYKQQPSTKHDPPNEATRVDASTSAEFFKYLEQSF
ncbi:hypothetical protein FT663_03488 [Candidozyma haemuli var. vulneris]|nr:hypothetical protein FT662_03358 [[Candida] haemuloni var. vulneris]KAF3989752.1 hypothetical protein FT663_03488 [[Candida] haemuloni var. vulneris]